MKEVFLDEQQRSHWASLRNELRVGGSLTPVLDSKGASLSHPTSINKKLCSGLKDK